MTAMANRIPISLDRPFLRDAIIEFRYDPQENLS